MTNKPLANWTPTDGIPSVIADHVANSTARLAYAHFPGKTAFDVSDIGKVIMQDDASSAWMCRSISPLKWRRVDSMAVYSVATLEDLVALTDVEFGQEIRVESVGRSYEFTPSGISPLAAMEVLAGVDGDWHTLNSTSDQKWLAQTDWYIDPVNGNDENPGTVGSPLLTDSERQRRWGGNIPATITASSVTIHLLAGTHNNVLVYGTPATSTCMLTIDGAVTTLVTTAISTGGYTKYTHGAYGGASPQATILVADGVSDWTPYVGKRVRSGASGTLLSWLAKVNPASGGVSTVRTSPFGSQATTGSRLWTQSDPVAGQALYVEDLPLVHQLRVMWQGAAPSSGVQVLLQNLAFDGEVALQPNESVRTRIYGCDFRTGSLENFLQSSTVGLGRIQGSRCAQTQQSDRVYHVGCLIVSDFLVGFTTSTISSCLIQGGAYGVSITGLASVLLSDLQVFDSTSGLVHPQSTCNLTLTNVSGSTATASATAIDLADGTLIKTSGTINLLSSSGVEIHFHGFPKVYGQGAIHWSDVPATGFQLGIWIGQKTLSSGIADVTLAPALTSIFVAGSWIEVWYATPAAGAGSLGYTNVTTGGFRIQSNNLSDSTSVVNYKAISLITRSNTIMPLSSS